MDNKEILETLWGWGREVQVNLKVDLLLTKGRDGLTAWHRAATMDNKLILETPWGWGSEVHVNLKDDLFLAKGTMEKVHGTAALNCFKVILEKLCGCGREVQITSKMTCCQPKVGME